jgi:hypothetical protein
MLKLTVVADCYVDTPLGTGLGLSSASPWTHNGVSATVFGWSTILWLTFTQLFASGIGGYGYIAGRLRTKWTTVQTDETGVSL